MKALTIRQPWASLIAIGVKTIETRTWKTNYRGTIAIHAGAHRLTGREVDDLNERWQYAGSGIGVDHFHTLFRRSGYTTEIHDMPLGAVIATANLVDCLPIIGAYDLAPEGECIRRTSDLSLFHVLSLGGFGTRTTGIPNQLPYGDYTPGNWAWMLEDVKPCDPIPAKGKQGLWNWAGVS